MFIWTLERLSWTRTIFLHWAPPWLFFLLFVYETWVFLATYPVSIAYSLKILHFLLIDENQFCKIIWICFFIIIFSSSSLIHSLSLTFSAGGVIASALVVACLFWVGTVDGVNVHDKGTPLNLSGLPVAIGLYGFCYSGHAVFPNIYSSMQKPSDYPSVLLTRYLHLW